TGFAVGYHAGILQGEWFKSTMREVIARIAEHTETSVTEVERLIVNSSNYLVGWIESGPEDGKTDTKIAAEVGLPVKLVREVIEREDLQRKADAARVAKGLRPGPVTTPVWCKPGDLAERAALLFQAIEATMWKGLHLYDEIYPRALPKAERDR